MAAAQDGRARVLQLRSAGRMCGDTRFCPLPLRAGIRTGVGVALPRRRGEGEDGEASLCHPWNENVIVISATSTEVARSVLLVERFGVRSGGNEDGEES